MTLKVMAQQCDQCLFSENRIVSKRRFAQIIRDCRAKDTNFVCHKASIAGTEACCRAFYDTQTSQMIRIAQRLNAVQFVKESEL